LEGQFLMVGQILVIMAMSLLFCHELDAVYRHEWRIMPGINRLSEEIGALVFIFAHVPVFGVIIWLVFVAEGEMQKNSGLAFSGFCMVHVLLHKLFEKHPQNEFDNILSQLLIWGAGIAGAGHILQVGL
jgi:hypothetical protein